MRRTPLYAGCILHRSIRLSVPHPTAQPPLLLIHPQEPSAQADASPSSGLAFGMIYPSQDSRDMQQNQAEVGVTGEHSREVEKYALDHARGGLGGNLGWRSDDFGNGLEY